MYKSYRLIVLWFKLYLFHANIQCNSNIIDTLSHSVSDEERVKLEPLGNRSLSATVVNEIMDVLHSALAGKGMKEVPDSSLFQALQDGGEVSRIILSIYDSIKKIVDCEKGTRVFKFYDLHLWNSRFMHLS